MNKLERLQVEHNLRVVNKWGYTAVVVVLVIWLFQTTIQSEARLTTLEQHHAEVEESE